MVAVGAFGQGSDVGVGGFGSRVRAYLLKKQLRLVFSTRGETGRELLAGWLAWARRSQLPGFVAIAATIKRFQQLIFDTLDHGLSNALSEATNTHLRALT